MTIWRPVPILTFHPVNSPFCSKVIRESLARWWNRTFAHALKDGKGETGRSFRTDGRGWCMLPMSQVSHATTMQIEENVSSPQKKFELTHLNPCWEETSPKRCLLPSRWLSFSWTVSWTMIILSPGYSGLLGTSGIICLLAVIAFQREIVRTTHTQRFYERNQWRW